MKRNWGCLILFAWVLLGSGCSTLTVDVDLYRGRLPQSRASLRAPAQAVLGEESFSEEGRARLREELLMELREIYDSTNQEVLRVAFTPALEATAQARLGEAQSEVARLEKKRGVEPNELRRARVELEKAEEEVQSESLHRKVEASVAIELAKRWRDISASIERSWEAFDAKARSIEKAASTLLALAGGKGHDEASSDLRRTHEAFLAELHSLDGVVASLQADIRAHYRAQLRDGDARVESILTAVSEAVDRATGGGRATGVGSRVDASGRHVGYPIFDRDVHYVVRELLPREDDENWGDFVTNRFRVNGGDSQFMVKSEGQIIFRQKSLDFDPTPVIGAGAAVAKLGVEIGSALTSGSLTLSSKGPEGSVSIDLAAREAQLAAKRRARRELLLELARLREALEEAGEDRDALQRIHEKIRAALIVFERASKANASDRYEAKVRYDGKM